MNEEIKQLMDSATHASLVIYDINKNQVSIITKGGFNDVEVIAMLEEAIYALGRKIADNQVRILQN